MSEMVERVATALKQSIDNSPHNFGSDGVERVFDDAARAALEAMREPTAAMLKAEGPFGRRVDNFLDDWDAVDVWLAMIDEALKD